MAEERTFAIIKPDAVSKRATGAILKMIEESGLEIVGMKRFWSECISFFAFAILTSNSVMNCLFE